MLSLIAWVYGKIVALRNYLYDRGWLDTFDLGVHTVSIGNITTGGTGKTPLVAHVANVLAERGETVCVLTRGYKRKNEKQRVLVSDGEQILTDPFTSGDEPFELAQKLLGRAIVLADADRASAGEWAKRKFGVTAFVLDDGFQHRRVRRDVDIVCIDATDPFGGGKPLPAGRLREGVEGLRRADVVVITRSDLVKDISDLRSEISTVNSRCPVYVSKNTIAGVTPLQEFHATTQRTQGKKGDPKGWCLAFCGIGNPESFFELLKANGFDLAATKSFRDHHVYAQDDIRSIEAAARDAGACVLLTTAKDAVKLSNLEFDIPCFVVEIKGEIDDGEKLAKAV